MEVMETVAQKVVIKAVQGVIKSLRLLLLPNLLNLPLPLNYVTSALQTV
jgi:hypothetical protein